MGQRLVDVVCGDDYTDAATISGVYQSPGGYYTISGASVFMELEYSQDPRGWQGSLAWTTPEVAVGISQGVFFAGTTGVRFRNKTPGALAMVTAGIAERGEPVFSVGAA